MKTAHGKYMSSFYRETIQTFVYNFQLSKSILEFLGVNGEKLGLCLHFFDFFCDFFHSN